MFGMTKRQFLKRSKKCLNETGILILLLKDINYKNAQGKISDQEASKHINSLRKSLESIFSEYEENEPPSKCNLLKQKILHVLIDLHEAIVYDSESLTAASIGMEKKSLDKLEESQHHMEEFRSDFLDIVKEVDALLKKKHEKKI